VSEGLESNEVSEGVSALSAIKKKERKKEKLGKALCKKAGERGYND